MTGCWIHVLLYLIGTCIGDFACPALDLQYSGYDTVHQFTVINRLPTG